MRRFVRPQKNAGKTTMIIIVGAVLMILIDTALTKWDEFSKDRIRDNGEHSSLLKGSEIADFASARSLKYEGGPISDFAADIYLFVPQAEPLENKEPGHSSDKAAITDEGEGRSVTSQKPVLPPFDGTPKVVIIIDDMGIDIGRSRKIINMDARFTLAFLPYAPAVKKLAKEALAKGHELLIHVPMEPINADLDPGPMALLNDMPQEEIVANLQTMMKSFDGYVGINNHMGSKLTQNREAMTTVMDSLASHNLIFVDSKTIHSSVAGQMAGLAGLSFAERDVFLDHHDDREFVMQSLKKLEEVARRRGVAIAIGHPRDATIEGLAAWLPTLEDKNIRLVTVSDVVTKLKGHDNAREVTLSGLKEEAAPDGEESRLVSKTSSPAARP